MHYEVSGSSLCKQTVCFIHGLCCDLTDWEHQRTHFQDRYRVIGCDLKGHGYSAVSVEPVSIENWAVDIAELLDSLNVQNVVLVGHSMGGRGPSQSVTPAGLRGPGFGGDEPTPRVGIHSGDRRPATG